MLKQFYIKNGRRPWPKNYYYFWKCIDAELNLDWSYHRMLYWYAKGEEEEGIKSILKSINTLHNP